MSSPDSMITKIQALLAQAESPGATDEEAEAFSAKAEELMAKYSIDQARVKAAERKTTPENVESIQVDLSEVSYSHRKASLISTIASTYGCKTVQYPMPGYNAKQLSHVVIVGFRSDLDLTVTLYNSLVVQAEQAQTRQIKLASPSENLRTWRTSWWHGFTTRIGRRLYVTQNQAKEATVEAGQPSTELVLRDRNVAVAAKYKEMFPNTVTKRSTYRRSSSGFGHGKDAADSADIGRTRLGSSRGELKS